MTAPNCILNLVRQFPQLLGILLLFCLIQIPRQVIAISPIILSSRIANNSETSKVCLTDLAWKINKIIEDDKFRRARWGIFIQTLDSRETLYKLEPQKYFTVASNVKLLITAATLSEFGLQFRFKTPVYMTGEFPNLKTLKVIGNGDPSLTTQNLKNLAKTLKNKGIQKIEQLIVESGELSDWEVNRTWEWEDLHYYYAPLVNNLILNENTVSLTLFPQKVGEKLKLEWSDKIAAKQWQINHQAITSNKNIPSWIDIQRDIAKPILTIKGNLPVDSEPNIFKLAVIDPDTYFVENLQNILRQEGIIVNRSIISKNSNIDRNLDKKITTIESKNLVELITKTNQESNNIYAESLLKLFKKKFPKLSTVEALKTTLTSLGLDSNSYQLRDASGLSRHNLVAPEALVTVLRLMAKTSEAENYRQSLALAGVNGTLKTRFRDTIIEGNFQGKTGTMSGISGLSGYLMNSSYSPLAISIIVNQSEVPVSETREAIDSIVLLLGKLIRC